jgi:DNA (cytosine-5)-methyltransferase 3A
MQRAHGYNKGGAKYGKAPTLTANGSYVHNNHVVEPVIEAFAYRDKSPALLASYAHAGQRNFIEDIGGPHTGYVGVPIRIGEIELDGESHAKYTGSAANRVYSPEGKARTLISNGGGGGAKTGLYAVPSPLDAPASTDTPAKGKRVYTVKDGKIEKDGMFYPINLPDGAYIMRKLTVRECCRLQTLPDDYFLDANGVQVISDTQAVKATGNGWTAEVIIHILSHGLRGVPRDEPLEVLSMYDGIATGRYCLEKLGFSNVRYYGSEIDKYAIKAALNRFPDIKHLGDAFAIREFTWEQWKKSVD